MMLAILKVAPWERMWLLAGVIFSLCKWASWRAIPRPTSSWKNVAYLCAWPGMDAEAFLKRRAVSPPATEWLWAISKTVGGILLIWGLFPHWPFDQPYVRGWVGMIGLAFLLHFGTFHLLSCLWRSLGIEATPLMKNPVCSASLSDFWGCRWNRAFRDLTHRMIFLPLARPLGSGWALFLGFVVSGVVHDIVISVPSAGGYGLPTVYFLLQGCGLLAEKSLAGRSMGLGSGWRGRVFCLIVTALPAPLLFHPPFVTRIILPFLEAVGATT